MAQCPLLRTLVDPAISDLLPRRRPMVCQNSLESKTWQGDGLNLGQIYGFLLQPNIIRRKKLILF